MTINYEEECKKVNQLSTANLKSVKVYIIPQGMKKVGFVTSVPSADLYYSSITCDWNQTSALAIDQNSSISSTL